MTDLFLALGCSAHVRSAWVALATCSLLIACGDGPSSGQTPVTTTGIEPGTAGDDDDDDEDTTAGDDDDDDADDDSTGDSGGMACTASEQCPEGEACANGTCTPTDGPCSTHSDCDGDTYCCAEGCLPDGETDGVCIPFDDGEVNEECLGEVVIGLFEPDVQCEWTGPQPGDPFPDHDSVLTTPLVADLPYDTNHAGEIVIVTYNCEDGGAESGWGSDPACFGVIRIINGQTCELTDSLDDPAHRIVAASPPAIGDLDGDGFPEIVTQRAVSGLIAYEWSAGTYVTKWTALDTAYGVDSFRWDGPSIHDLDDDGLPEVISGSEVFDGATGVRLNPGQSIPGAVNNIFSVVGDLDQDGNAELVGTGVYRWNVGTNQWDMAYTGGPGGRHYAFADFGTPGVTPQDFDGSQLDGVAEVVTVTSGSVLLHTLDGQELLNVAGISGGGPPTIGDFDNDGFPEIASAGGASFRVFDLDCIAGGVGCISPGVRWITASQDLSSATTGSSIFDFEGDGAAEAVYGDECYLRVYDGASGDVLYSAARTSCTWYENAIVADPDNDDNTEILIGSNTNCSVTCPEIDPIHPGVRCEDDDGCPGSCVAGFCRCVDDTECTDGHVCTMPTPDVPAGGNTCRATHPPGIALGGVRVLRDRLDRWASSRPLWNQHAYSITNVEDDLSIAATGAWAQNFAVADLNNYRQNRQGDASAEDLPDITGKLEDTACTLGEVGQDITLVGTVCNRGLKAVAAALPATFYLGDPADGNVLCVAYTAEPVPVSECREVSCEIGNAISGEVTMVVNDDGMGGMLTVECIDDNNTDVVVVDECLPPG